MAVQILMPALSPTREEGTLAKWLVKEGDTVKSGQILAEIETDKATMEFEAVDEGTVTEILIPEGAEGVKVGTVIATISGEDEESVPAPKPLTAPPPPPPAPKAKATPPPPSPAANGPTVKMTVREALRDAMAE